MPATVKVCDVEGETVLVQEEKLVINATHKFIFITLLRSGYPAKILEEVNENYTLSDVVSAIRELETFGCIVGYKGRTYALTLIGRELAERAQERLTHDSKS